MSIFSKIGAVLGIASPGVDVHGDASANGQVDDDFVFPISRREALKKRKARKAQKAAKKARRRNRR